MHAVICIFDCYVMLGPIYNKVHNVEANNKVGKVLTSQCTMMPPANTTEATATWRFTNFVLYCIVLSDPCIYDGSAASCQQSSHRPQTPPGVATWEVSLSARNVVPCVCWPATGITAHNL